MKQNDLFERVIRAAREQVPSDAVPYAFEKRIMSNLPALVRIDVLAQWSRNLWRAAGASVLLCAAVSTWSYHRISRETTPEAVSIAFEKTVFASMDQPIEDVW